jgi:hypothetical protein
MVQSDNRNKFKVGFIQTCRHNVLKGKPTGTYDPQSNGIIEQIHLVIGNILRTFEKEHQDLPPIMPFWTFISAASWVILSTYHTTLQATPGQLALVEICYFQSRSGQTQLEPNSKNMDRLRKVFLAETTQEYNMNTRPVTKYCLINLAYCIDLLSQEQDHIL